MPDKPVPESVKELDEPKQPATEPAAKPMNPPVQKHCRVCGEQLDEKHHKYCSTECWRIAKANKSSASSEPRQAQQQSDPMHEEAAREPVIAKTVKNQTVSKRGILGEGAPTKCTPELIEAVVRDRCRGFSLEQSCAYNGCSHDQWTEWEKRPEFVTVRHRAEAGQLDHILNSMDEAIKNKLDWRGYSFLLERLKAFKDQFADPNKAAAIQINQQFNNGIPGFSQAELEETRRRLDDTKLRQKKRKTGAATNAELLEHVNSEIQELQYFRDRLLAGETPDQEDQQRLYQRHEEGRDHHEEQPIREAIGHVVGKPLALEGGSGYVLEPEPTAAAAPPPASPISQAPSEPEHVRQCDRKLPIGPPSERQRQRLEQERARRGGDGKGVF
jgi:hypothetical protein